MSSATMILIMCKVSFLIHNWPLPTKLLDFKSIDTVFECDFFISKVMTLSLEGQEMIYFTDREATMKSMEVKVMTSFMENLATIRYMVMKVSGSRLMRWCILQC